jgi:RNA polymerase-associated protein CTR9
LFIFLSIYCSQLSFLSQRERQIDLERKAKILAEERRLAREQALEWTREVKVESDEEKERKSKRSRKPKTEGSGDEGGESKKKRRGKTKKEEQGEDPKKDEQGEQSQALFSDEEDTGKPKKGRSVKKRVVRDEDDEEGVISPRKKQL